METGTRTIENVFEIECDKDYNFTVLHNADYIDVVLTDIVLDWLSANMGAEGTVEINGLVGWDYWPATHNSPAEYDEYMLEYRAFLIDDRNRQIELPKAVCNSFCESVSEILKD